MRSPPWALLASTTRGAPRHSGRAPRGRAVCSQPCFVLSELLEGGWARGLQARCCGSPELTVGQPGLAPPAGAREPLFSLPLGIFTLADTLCTFWALSTVIGPRACGAHGQAGPGWHPPAGVRCAAGAAGSSVSRGLRLPPMAAMFSGGPGRRASAGLSAVGTDGTGRGWLHLAAPLASGNGCTGSGVLLAACPWLRTLSRKLKTLCP